MSEINLSLDCDSISINPSSHRRISVNLDSVDESDVLNHFKLKDVIGHFGIAEVLDEIGIDEAKDHFDLVEESQNDGD